MKWVLIIAAAWVAVGVPLALLIGRAVRIADAQESGSSALDEDDVVDGLQMDGPVSGFSGRTDWLEDLWRNEAQPPLHPPTDRDRPTIPGLPAARPTPPRPPPVPDRRSSKPQQPPPIRRAQEG
jgi:hypothetical protein